jgi:phosphoglycolate phosphatase-like HAD superfamily hydrolase
MVTLVAFDFGHTLMHERKDADVHLDVRPVHLMPDVLDVLPLIPVPMAVWANTRTARESEIRKWLARAGIERFFTSVVTSVDAGARKPSPAFFEFALARCGRLRGDVLFVGNQLNTDIRGGEEFGIRTVWVCGPEYRSDDDDEQGAIEPSYSIQRLHELPDVLMGLGRVRETGRTIS